MKKSTPKRDYNKPLTKKQKEEVRLKSKKPGSLVSPPSHHQTARAKRNSKRK